MYKNQLTTTFSLLYSPLKFFLIIREIITNFRNKAIENRSNGGI